MRTAQFLLAGVLMFAASLVLGKLFEAEFPRASRVALAGYLVVWFGATAFNAWVGVTRAGYSPMEEFQVLLLLFGLPAGIAVAVHAIWG